MTELDRRSFLKTGAAVAAGAAWSAARSPGSSRRRPSRVTVGTVRPPSGAHPRPARRRGAACSCRPVPVPLVPASSRARRRPTCHPTGAGRRIADPRAARRHGRLRGAGADERDPGPQPRGEWLGRGRPVRGGAARPTTTRRLGGTSTVHVTARRCRASSSYASLAGTQMNCSGGRMPWGSWITCEETVNGHDVGDDFTRTPPAAPTPARSPTSERPAAEAARLHLRGAGRRRGRRASRSRTAGGSRTRRWPATPSDGALYLTEDNFALPVGFYHYVPPAGPDGPAGSSTAASCRC